MNGGVSVIWIEIVNTPIRYYLELQVALGLSLSSLNLPFSNEIGLDWDSSGDSVLCRLSTSFCYEKSTSVYSVNYKNVTNFLFIGIWNMSIVSILCMNSLQARLGHIYLKSAKLAVEHNVFYVMYWSCYHLWMTQLGLPYKCKRRLIVIIDAAILCHKKWTIKRNINVREIYTFVRHIVESGWETGVEWYTLWYSVVTIDVIHLMSSNGWI